jgi:hypothetical protein
VVLAFLRSLKSAKQGAEVIKVESLTGAKERGDDGTTVPNSTFAMVNRNKKSVSIDLQTKEGVALLLKLVAAADGTQVRLTARALKLSAGLVFIQNFRPGVVERLGIGYDDIKMVAIICFESGTCVIVYICTRKIASIFYASVPGVARAVQGVANGEPLGR